MQDSGTDLSPDPAGAENALTRFLAQFDAFCALTQKPAGPVSRALFGDSGRVAAIRNTQSDLGAKRLAKAARDLAAMAAEAGITLPDPVDNADSETAAQRQPGEEAA